MWLPDLPDIGLRRADLAATVDAVADWQLPSGMIPWFPGGHADPWNHVEATMALIVGGRRTAAERAFDWLAARQRPDGAWNRYELADRIEEDKADANVCAYPATGLWHHWLCHRDRGLLEELWPMLDAAVAFVLGLQTRRGEVLWARHADGTPWPYALLTGSSSVSHSLRCAVAVAAELGYERPEWAAAAARLLRVIATEPDAFAPKDRWAMDWYYPVLVGALGEAEAVTRLRGGWDRFVLDDRIGGGDGPGDDADRGRLRGVRCVADQPWVTTAETCECALAHLRVGDGERARRLLAATADLRDPSTGHYWTGRVFPGEVNFPAEERSTYSGAAVVLCADALAGASPASGLFCDPRVLPAGWAVGASTGLVRSPD